MDKGQSKPGTTRYTAKAPRDTGQGLPKSPTGHIERYTAKATKSPGETFDAQQNERGTVQSSAQLRSGRVQDATVSADGERRVRGENLGGKK